MRVQRAFCFTRLMGATILKLVVCSTNIYNNFWVIYIKKQYWKTIIFRLFSNCIYDRTIYSIAISRTRHRSSEEFSASGCR